MRRGWWVAMVVGLSVMAAGPGAVRAQDGMAARLLGRWEGSVLPPPPPAPAPRQAPPLRRDRSEEVAVYALVIESVTPADGRWTARGSFGRADGKPTPVTVTITEGPDGPRLQFGHGRGVVTHLTLRGEGVLTGTLGKRGASEEPALTLRRVR